MNRVQTMLDSLSTQSAEVAVGGFVVNLLLAAILSFILSRVYVRYGRALSNRSMFARNFMLIAMTTMVVITIVKSSLALSLGLVGALSIVRFRAAIKEPEELAYLFLAIAIGLGLGADQRVISLVAFGIITGVIWLGSLSHRSEQNQNLYLTIASHNPKKIELTKIVEILKACCSEVELKRFDETREILEASFQVTCEDFTQLEASNSGLQALNKDVRITFLDNKGLV